MTCTHDPGEIDTAAHFDGLCPICLSADNARLRTALEDALRYVEAVVFNAQPRHRQKQQNYRDCAVRIKAALSPHDAMFTCLKCEANYSVVHLEQPVTECPVCGWKRRDEQSPHKEPGAT